MFLHTLHNHKVCPAEPALNYTGVGRQVITLQGKSFSVQFSLPCFLHPPLISCTITLLDEARAGEIERMNYHRIFQSNIYIYKYKYIKFLITLSVSWYLRILFKHFRQKIQLRSVIRILSWFFFLCKYLNTKPLGRFVSWHGFKTHVYTASGCCLSSKTCGRIFYCSGVRE